MRIVLDPALLNAQPLGIALEAASAAGYEGVELGNRPDVIPAFAAVAGSSAGLRAIRQSATLTGVEIASVAVIQAWSTPDEDRRRQAVAWWQDGIAAAIELGCPRINTELSGDPGRPAQSRAALLRSMEALLPTIEREGVRIVVEPHPGDFIETTTGALALLEEIGSDRVGYLHCVPHTFYLGGSTTEQVAQAGENLDHVHVADTYRPERVIVNPAGLGARIHEHFDIGRGEIDWPEVVTALRSVGFDGILTVQVFGWEDRAEPSFRANRSALAGLFEEAPS